MRLIDADDFRSWLLKQKRLSKDYILMMLDETPTIDPVKRTQQEAELPAREGFEYVKNVEVSKQLAKLLKPYHGCPRGAMGMPGTIPGDAKAKLLLDAKDFLLKGQDEIFVCVPKMWYEHYVKVLEEL